LYHQDFIDIIM